MEKINAFFRIYLDELKKVQWSKFEELQANTITVLVASLILALVISVMDITFNYSLGQLYSLFQ